MDSLQDALQDCWVFLKVLWVQCPKKMPNHLYPHTLSSANEHQLSLLWLPFLLGSLSCGPHSINENVFFWNRSIVANSIQPNELERIRISLSPSLIRSFTCFVQVSSHHCNKIRQLAYKERLIIFGSQDFPDWLPMVLLACGNAKHDAKNKEQERKVATKATKEKGETTDPELDLNSERYHNCSTMLPWRPSLQCIRFCGHSRSLQCSVKVKIQVRFFLIPN